MKRANWLLGVGAALMFVGYGAMSIGCSDAGSDRPPVSQLNDGVNLLSANDPAWGLNAAYVKNGHAIYVQTRVGGPKPDVYRQAWPYDPANEMDMRFVNDRGETFFAMRGGDKFVDSTWDAEITRTAATPAVATQRDANFVLAQESAKSLALAVGPKFTDHVFHLSAFAAHALPSEDRSMRRTDALSGTDVGYTTVSGAVTDLYSGSTGCFAWICSAKHSATRTWGYAGAIVLYSCNHGRCSYDSGMGYQCQSYGPGGSINGEGNRNNTAISGGCATAYNWNSGGWDHLCNDDAAYELWQTKNGNTGNNGVYGAGGGNVTFTWTNTGHFACACSNNSGCDGDWNRPNCP